MSIFVKNIDELLLEQSRYVVQTLGYYSVNDGGHSLFYYDENSTEPMDYGSCFTHVSGRGRWRMIPCSDYVSVRQFGCHGKYDCHKDIQRLFDYCSENNLIASGYGDLKLSGTVYSSCDMQMDRCKFIYPIGYRGYGLVVSPEKSVHGVSSRLRSKTINLPEVILKKDQRGWLPGSRGISLINLYHCTVKNNYVEGWDFGLRFWGQGGNGCVYNNVDTGYIQNNKANLHLYCSDMGWCNQNTFIGGTVGHYSGEVLEANQRVNGTKNIFLHDDSSYGGPNNNIFLNTSLEGFVDEFAVYSNGCSHNRFYNNRWEDGGVEGKTVWFSGKYSTKNVIAGGYHSEKLDMVESSGASGNRIEI